MLGIAGHGLVFQASDEHGTLYACAGTSGQCQFLERAVQRWGTCGWRPTAAGPAPTTIWDWFVEWYSDRYNPIITEKAATEFGKEYVHGTKAHIAFDESHDHDELMFRTVARAVEMFSTPRRRTPT